MSIFGQRLRTAGTPRTATQGHLAARAHPLPERSGVSGGVVRVP